MEVDPQQGPAGSGAGVGQGSPLRGLCHACECEVVPTPLQDGSFRCPLCNETYVECPYESFERWQGDWYVFLPRGRTPRTRAEQLRIDERGAATLTTAAPGTLRWEQLSCRLVWAPDEHDGYPMRLDGLGGQEARRHLGLAQSAGTPRLRVRVACPGGEVLEGAARPGRAAGGRSPLSLMHQLMDTSGREAMPDAARGGGAGQAAEAGAPELSQLLGLQRVLNRGFDHMAAQMEGAVGTDRDQATEQLRQVTAPVLRAMLGVGGPLSQRGGSGAARAGRLRRLLEALEAGGGLLEPEERPRRGIDPAALARWLQSKSIDGAGNLEPDWQCPICFDSDLSELVAICQDDAGRAIHLFHRPCVEPWLLRRNDCPTCRRAPVFEPQA